MTEEKKTPTIEQMKVYQKIWDHLNEKLFDNEIEPCMLVMTRHKRALAGYFSDGKWVNDEEKKVHELAVNANLMTLGNPIEVLQTVAHEMVHQWQFDKGTPGRPGYHNKEWADKMKEIGLQPICQDTGAKDGQETGQNVTDKLISGGKAEMVFATMTEDFDFPYWSSEMVAIDNAGQPVPIELPKPGDGSRPQPVPGSSGTRTKFTCAMCGLNAWAKHSANLICGDCNRPMIAAV